jgi:hypothetical protein
MRSLRRLLRTQRIAARWGLQCHQDGKEWKQCSRKIREGQNNSERSRVAATMYVLYIERVESKLYNSEATHDMTSSHESVTQAYCVIKLHPIAVTTNSLLVKNRLCLCPFAFAALCRCRRLSRALELAGFVHVDTEDSNFVIEYLNRLSMSLCLMRAQGMIKTT